MYLGSYLYYNDTYKSEKRNPSGDSFPKKHLKKNKKNVKKQVQIPPPPPPKKTFPLKLGQKYTK